MSYKVEIRAVGETSWHSNALRFATQDEAEGSGRSLFMRWFGCDAYRTAESDEPVNYKFVDGRDIPLESENG